MGETLPALSSPRAMSDPFSHLPAKVWTIDAGQDKTRRLLSRPSCPNILRQPASSHSWPQAARCAMPWSRFPMRSLLRQEGSSSTFLPIRWLLPDLAACRFSPLAQLFDRPPLLRGNRIIGPAAACLMPIQPRHRLQAVPRRTFLHAPLNRPTGRVLANCSRLKQHETFALRKHEEGEREPAETAPNQPGVVT